MKKNIAVIIVVCIFVSLVSCATVNKVANLHEIPKRNKSAISGSEFVEKAKNLDAEERENFILQEIISGNFPNFMRKLAEIKTSIEVDGKLVEAKYFVMPDYLMVGNDTDFVRLPMQPKTAQKIANAFGFFLSTSKICDDIYNAAEVKLEPRPLTVDRDSFLTFVEHHNIIENQRQQRKGLIAGIKKDVVITGELLLYKNIKKVAIYGWHKLDGIPIQPVYSGHIDWYVDYSHGVRLIFQTIFVDGKPVNYKDILSDEKLKSLLCKETDCNYFAYPIN
jgi:hypothetical protein